MKEGGKGDSLRHRKGLHQIHAPSLRDLEFRAGCILLENIETKNPAIRDILLRMSQLKVLGDDRRVLEPVAGCIATMKVEGGRSSCLLPCSNTILIGYSSRWKVSVERVSVQLYVCGLLGVA
ncbi:uncharacterized protein LAJ45_10090 [Morchella importuna]|uniref:uncharacterized protein n=1 Tax=Morchella importuna TaxID=1174673 RepID=UPI001E8D48F1|nr:uncharacterized protein LAJ45_10090 [Morchella importuna]KAH8145948.1 hypothetical protein LAJ45_10090 [Morchella importuna]